MSKSEYNKKAFVTGAAILGIAGLICKIIGAFFRIPLRNMMGVAGMTYYSTVYPYYSTLLVVSSAGLPTAVSKLVSERITIGDYQGAKKVFRDALILLTVIGLITTALMFFGSDFLARITNCPGSEKSFRALAPALLIVSIMCAYRGYLQGLQKMTGTALSQLMEQVGKLVISLILVRLWLPYGFDIAAMGALLGITASEFIALIVIIFFYLKEDRRASADRSQDLQVHDQINNDHIVRKILVLAIPVTIGASIMPLTGIVDTLLIKNIMLGCGFTRQFADMCFAVFRTDVSTVINMPAVLTVALSMSLVPAISEANAIKDRKRTHQVSIMGIKLAMLVGMPCAIGLYVLGRDVIDFLFKVTPEELSIGTQLMQISSIGIIFLSLVQTLTGCIQGHGKPIVPVINLAVGAVVKVVVMIVLMNNPAIHIKGAAISTVCCYAVAGVLDLIYLVRLSGIKVKVWDYFGKPIVASAMMGIVVFACQNLMRHSHLPQAVITLAGVAVGVIVYGICIVLLRFLNKYDLELIPGGERISKLIPGLKK